VDLPTNPKLAFFKISGGILAVCLFRQAVYTAPGVFALIRREVEIKNATTFRA